MALRPIQSIPGLVGDTRALLEEINTLRAQLNIALASQGVTGLKTSDYAAREGERVRIRGGLTLTLPKARLQNQGARISAMIEGPGSLTIQADRSTVNEQTSVRSGRRLIIFESNGDGNWASTEDLDADSDSFGSDARFVLGAAHGSLPNAAVGTDTTEVDFSFAPGRVATWVLNTASVAFSKLANLTGLSVLGRAANSAGVMAAITSTAARQVLRNNDAGTSLTWGFPVEAQLNDVDIGDIHTLNVERGRFSVASGIGTLEKPQQVEVNPFAGGTYNSYTLPATLVHGDILFWQITGAVTLNGIVSTGIPDGFEFTLTQSNGGFPDGFQLTINDESGSAGAAEYRFGTPDNISIIVGTAGAVRIRRSGSSAGGRWLIIERGFPRSSTSIVYGGTSGREVQTATISGAISIAQNSVTSLFSGIRFNNAAQNDRSNLNFGSSASNILDAADDPGGDELEIRFQRAALTGDVTASQNSNATTIANDAVTNAKAANMNARTVKANPTNAAADPQDVQATVARHVLRANDAATALEWGNPVELRDETNTDQGDAYQLRYRSGDSMTAAVSSAAGLGVIRHHYVGNTAEIVNSAATGNLGTIDISTLTCGGAYRISAASSSFQIEGFTAKSVGFWFHFYWDESLTDKCTLFNEDATATAANRLRMPGAVDLVADPPVQGIFIYGGDSRWHWVSGALTRIGSTAAFVQAAAAAGTAVINIDTSAGDINITAGGAGDITLSTDDSAGGNLRLDSDLVIVSSGDQTLGGFIGIIESSASSPSAGAGTGILWARNDSPCEPGWTDDTNADHRFMLFRDVVSEVEITSATGNLGTIDISALKCGGSVNLSSSTGNWEIEGFTSKAEGFWFMFVSNNANTGTIRNEDATATTTDRIRLSSGDVAGVLNDYSGIGPQFLAYYMQSRWRITLMGNL